MKVSYIYHSCFVVELDRIIYIFDYYKGELPKFDSSKQIIFFASHKHHDHFTLDIFKYEKEYPNIKYVLSNDIKLSKNYLQKNGINPDVKERIISINKNKSVELQFDNIKMQIETLRSTDEGVAFIITYKNKTIYHAGDLNWWSWIGETEEEYNEMTKAYISEIDKVQGRHFDVAFVVLDPRQEERYWWGFDYFMKNTNTKIVFPMHCWDDYSVIEQMIQNPKAKDYYKKIVKIQENMTYELDES